MSSEENECKPLAGGSDPLVQKFCYFDYLDSENMTQALQQCPDQSDATSLINCSLHGGGGRGLHLSLSELN